MLKAAAPAFAAQGAPIRQRLLSGTVIGSDATRFRVGKDKWWLWVFQNPDSCYFIMAPGRGKDVVAQFLGGVRPPAWGSDRLGSQVGWADKHQACLAHYADLRVMPTSLSQSAWTAVIAAAGAA